MSEYEMATVAGSGRVRTIRNAGASFDRLRMSGNGVRIRASGWTEANDRRPIREK